MIYAKTVCKKPGSYVEIVPMGLRVSLQYNENGILQAIKVLKGAESEEIGREHFAKLAMSVPQKIMLTGGTTWVEGVYYFSKISFASGMIAECGAEDYLARALDGSEYCGFYAATVTSYAASFVGAQTIRNWLGMNKFTLLPGTVVPQDFTEDTIKMLIQTGTYSFVYPYIAGFYVFNGSDTEFIPSDLQQGTVTAVDTTLTPDGYVMSTVLTDNGSFTVNYSDICAWSIQEGASVLYCIGDYVEVLAARSEKGRLKAIDNRVTCPVCHKTYTAPAHGPVECDDPHCLSKSYPAIQRMLSVLELPELSLDDYRQLISDKKIITETDVLVVEPYAEMNIRGTLLTALQAAVPPSVCNDVAFFDKLINECNNTVETLLYYIKNPNKMLTEMSVQSVAGRRFVEWCRDQYNVITIMTLLSAIHIEGQPEVVTDLPPIFRGRRFVITGVFKRGSYEKIKDILEKCAGTVIPDLDKDIPDIVITGGTNEAIEGRIVQAARALNVSLVDEDTFFASLDLDNDIAASHLL